MVQLARPGQVGRFAIALRREFAHALGITEAELGPRVQYAKVAELQRRGLVHFHAVVRLDGPGPEFPDPGLPVAVATLTDAIKSAAGKAVYGPTAIGAVNVAVSHDAGPGLPREPQGL